MTKTVVNAGVMLGIAVAILQFISGITGLYKNPGLSWVFPLVAIAIEIVVVVWGLRQTAKLGKGYGGQVGAGVLIAVVGAVIIFVTSMIWSRVFPGAGEVMAAAQADAWADQGMSEEQITQMLQTTAFTRTPLFMAIMGSIYTILTGLVISLIAAIWVRHKEQPAA